MNNKTLNVYKERIALGDQAAVGETFTFLESYLEQKLRRSIFDDTDRSQFIFRILDTFILGPEPKILKAKKNVLGYFQSIVQNELKDFPFNKAVDFMDPDEINDIMEADETNVESDPLEILLSQEENDRKEYEILSQLSKGEQEVMILLLKNNSYEEIREILNLSPSALWNKVDAIKKKLVK